MPNNSGRDTFAPGQFPSTHWSLIKRAGSPESPQARAALTELCSAYWYPIYAFIRRKGSGPDQALDLTQGFFARLLEKGIVTAAEPGKGRFRAFLRHRLPALPHRPISSSDGAGWRNSNGFDRCAPCRGALPVRAGRHAHARTDV